MIRISKSILIILSLFSCAYSFPIALKIKTNILALVNPFRPTIEGNIELDILDKVSIDLNYGQQYFPFDQSSDSLLFANYGNNFKIGIRIFLTKLPIGSKIISKGYFISSLEKKYSKTNIQDSYLIDHLGKIENTYFFTVGYGQSFQFKKLIWEASIEPGLASLNRTVIGSDEFSIPMNTFSNALLGYHAYNGIFPIIIFAMRIGLQIF